MNGHVSAFLTMSRPVCQLLPTASWRSRVTKTDFFDFLWCFRVSGFWRLRMLREQILVLFLELFWGSSGWRCASSGPISTSGYFGDPPLFAASLDCLFFKDVRNEITTFGVPRGPVYKGRGPFWWWNLVQIYVKCYAILKPKYGTRTTQKQHIFLTFSTFF